MASIIHSDRLIQTENRETGDNEGRAGAERLRRTVQKQEIRKKSSSRAVDGVETEAGNFVRNKS